MISGLINPKMSLVDVIQMTSLFSVWQNFLQKEATKSRVASLNRYEKVISGEFELKWKFTKATNRPENTTDIYIDKKVLTPY